MKHLVLLVGVLSILAMSCSRKHAVSKGIFQSGAHSDMDTTSKTDYVFPDDWLGNWSGELNIFTVNGLKQTLPMALDLSTTDTSGIYTWAIIYGHDSIAQRRDYVLKEVDKSLGHYVIDEKNGILIDAYHIHNELSSVFSVMGNTLVNAYRLEGNQLTFTVKIFPSEEIRTSGDTLLLDQKIPEVLSFQHTMSQVARLQKKCLVE